MNPAEHSKNSFVMLNGRLEVSHIVFYVPYAGLDRDIQGIRKVNRILRRFHSMRQMRLPSFRPLGCQEHNLLAAEIAEITRPGR